MIFTAKASDKTGKGKHKKMKKNCIIIGILIVIMAVFCMGCTSAKKLGNISQTYSQPETSVSNITFQGEAGDKIKFSFSSDVEEGALDIFVYDSDGNVVKELDRAKELETYMILEHSDTYTLQAEYEGFVGDFKVTIYKTEEN